MAGTTDDVSTDGWRLLLDEYAFVVNLTKSERSADEVLRAFFRRGAKGEDGLRYRHWKLEWQRKDLREENDHPLPSDGLFWRSDPECGIQIDIDYANSSARRTVQSLSWPQGELLATVCDLTLIQLNHDALLAFLRSVGLLAPAEPATEQIVVEQEGAETATLEPGAPEPPIAVSEPGALVLPIAVSEPPDAAPLPATEPLATSKRRSPAEQFIENHPRSADEMIPDYITRLLELPSCQWKRKTLQNRLYEISKRKR